LADADKQGGAACPIWWLVAPDTRGATTIAEECVMLLTAAILAWATWAVVMIHTTKIEARA